MNCANAYGSPGTCSTTCGAGTRTVTYKITATATNGGKACAIKAGATKSQACTVMACPVNCAGACDSWGTCSKTCGAGTQTGTYKITTAAANGGKACAIKSRRQEEQGLQAQDLPVLKGPLHHRLWRRRDELHVLRLPGRHLQSRRFARSLWSQQGQRRHCLLGCNR